MKRKQNDVYTGYDGNKMMNTAVKGTTGIVKAGVIGSVAVGTLGMLGSIFGK